MTASLPTLSIGLLAGQDPALAKPVSPHQLRWTLFQF